jgi:hypothetical protein
MQIACLGGLVYPCGRHARPIIAMDTLKTVLGKVAGVFLLAGILFGLFAIVTVPIEMSKKAEAENWPSRKAVITKSYADYRRGSGKSGGYYRTEICGRYADTEQPFCVTQIRFGGFRFGAGKASALETVAKYPAGAEVDIYYSPDNPKETVPEARSSWTEMYVMLGLGIGFLLLPVLLWAFRKRIDPVRYA